MKNVKMKTENEKPRINNFFLAEMSNE